jgi:o-succinylbenzoate synthase
MPVYSYQFDVSGYADIRIARIAIASYDLPLTRPWSSARGTLTRRRGWLLRLQSSDGVLGVGECAPLPGAGTEPFDDAATTLRTLLPGIAGQRADDVLEKLQGIARSPAARCAMETALVDLAATVAGCSVAKQLNPQAVESVPVNAMIGPLDSEVGIRAQRAVTEGYRVLKLKLGVVSPETEARALHELAHELPPEVSLRLDANRAWGEDTARAMIETLSGLPVEGLEEPLKDGGSKALHRLQAIAPWPLAIDESLAHSPLAELFSDPPVRRFVLKPMVVGGPMSALKIAARARSAGIEVIVTTTVDTAVGTLAALHTAAALAGNSTHGLATSSWLAEDVAEPPVIERGQIVVAPRPGLGVIPLESINFEDVSDV